MFDALLNEGSATRAAIKLGVSQAAVSASLARLRSVYADILFTRTRHGLAPTARALEIAPFVRDAMDAAILSLGNVPDNDVERFLRIGLSDDIELALGGEIVRGVAEVFPRARPVFRQTHSGIAADMLRDRAIDIAIGSGGLTGAGLQRQSVGESGYSTVSFVPPADGIAFTLEEFCTRGHLLISSSGLVGAVDTALLEAGRRRRVVASSSHFAAVPFLMRGTDWIATIPSHAALAHARHGELFISVSPVRLPPYPIELCTTTSNLRDHVIARSTEAIAQCLRRHFASINLEVNEDGSGGGT